VTVAQDEVLFLSPLQGSIFAKEASDYLMTSRQRTIGSVQRAIDILGLFDEGTGQLGITEISEALALHKSTAAGLVYTLEHNRYLEQDPVSRKYRLGFKLVERASTLLSQLDVRAAALPHLHALRDWCDETVNLAIRDGGEIIYVERLASRQALGMRTPVGSRAPMHCTALGKALLSALPPADTDRYVMRYGLPAVTPQSITERDRFVGEIETARERGYSVDDEENKPGVRCVAAPIVDHQGQPVAAVSISAPAHRLPAAAEPRYGAEVKAAADAISRRLGYGALEQ